MTLKQRLVAAGTLLTVGPLSIIGIAVFNAGQRANEAARESTVSLAHTDLDHVTQVAYLMTAAYHEGLTKRLEAELRNAVSRTSGDSPERAARDPQLTVSIERGASSVPSGIVRTRVGNEWHLSMAQARDGETVRISLPERVAVADLLAQLERVVIGKTGYIYVLRGDGEDRGSYVLSLKRKRDGENLWDARDASGHTFIQDIVHKAVQLGPGDTSELRYPWKNAEDVTARMKIARFKYLRLTAG